MIILSGYGGTPQQSGILHENPTILFTCWDPGKAGYLFYVNTTRRAVPNENVRKKWLQKMFL